MQALAEMAYFNDMNDHANQKLLAYTSKKHREEIDTLIEEHKMEVASLGDEKARLVKSFASSLNRTHQDSSQTISSLMQLIHEKDEVRRPKLSNAPTLLYFKVSV